MSRTLAFLFVLAAVGLTLSYAAHGAPPDLPDGGALYVVDSTTVAHAPPPVPPDLGTVTIVILGLGLASAVLRRVAGASHALQTPGGLLAMAVASAAITGVTAAATTYGLNWRALLAAAISGATSAVCAWNPSTAKQAAAAMLLFVGLSLSACAASPYDKARQSLTAINQVVTASTAALDAFDGPHQAELVEIARAACASQPAGAAFESCAHDGGAPALATYRGRRATAQRAIAVLDGSLAVAAAAVSTAEAMQPPGNLSPTALLAQLLPLARAVVDALTPLGIVPVSLSSLLGGL